MIPDSSIKSNSSLKSNMIPDSSIKSNSSINTSSDSRDNITAAATATEAAVASNKP